MLVQDDGMILADAQHSAFNSQNLKDVDAAFQEIYQKRMVPFLLRLMGKTEKLLFSRCLLWDGSWLFLLSKAKFFRSFMRW